VTQTFPESQEDWRRDANERFDKFVEPAGEDELQELVNCVFAGEQIIGDLRTSESEKDWRKKSAEISVIEATINTDWGEWGEDFGSGRFDLVVDLTHRVILPPRHNVRIVCSPDRVVDRILLRYEYYFDHTSVIIIDSDDEMELLIKYVKSLVFIRGFQHLLDRKEESILRLPLVGKLFHRLYFMVYTAKHQELIYETKSTQLMHQLEEWIATYLDDLKKRELKKSYDRYFEGVPEAQRGIWISM
jgi:hypothetical protein